MSKVAATVSVIDKVCDDRVDAEAARSALEAVTRFPPVSVARFALLALAGAAALVACLVVGTIITPIADRLRLLLRCSPSLRWCL
jgi:uncharacterized membrane protein YjjP (DUF1212 family)